MSNKNVGSLSEFIDIPIDIVNKDPKKTKRLFTKNQKNYVAMNAHQKKSKDIIMKQRAKTMISEYRASDKSPDIYKQKYHEDLTTTNWLRDYEQYSQSIIYKINASAKNSQAKRDISRGMMFPKKQNLIDFIKKNRPKPQETLLRCILKVNELSDNKNKKEDNQTGEAYEKMKSRYGEIYEKAGLNEPHLYEPKFKNKIENIEIKVSRPQLYGGRVHQKKTPHKISSLKRIEFEQNLSWAKKHKKNFSYYENELGKKVQELKLNDSLRDRQKIMHIIYQKPHHIKNTPRKETPSSRKTHRDKKQALNESPKKQLENSHYS